MTQWDRISRLELELQLLRVELDHVKGERDRARDLAVRLEQELDGLTHVRYLGEAT